MAVSIGTRLFLMGMLSMAVAGMLALGVVRWSLSGAMSSTTLHQAERVDVLVRDLSARFDEHGDWRFLPADARARSAWLRASVARAERGQTSDESSALAQRIALTDAAGRRLAGHKPGALLVAIASIDQRRWVIPSRRGVAGYLSVALPRNPDDALTIAFLIQKQHNLALLATVAAILAALSAAVVAASFRRPLRALVDGARRLGRGELDARVDARRRDEFGELARSFNDLGARLDAAAHARRQWIADTSHELRTPLAVMQAQVEAMQDGIRPMSQESIAAMAAQVGALRMLVADLDQLARGDVGTLHLQQDRLDFWAVAVTAWEGFEERLRARGLALQLVPAIGPALGKGDAARLGQVLRNLLENSARYTTPGGRVVLTGVIESAHLQLQLDDSAPGVAEADLDRLGERFFRVDPSRSREHGGSGLGLALSRQIVEAHGGSLSFSASPLGGLRARITLPLEAA